MTVWIINLCVTKDRKGFFLRLDMNWWSGAPLETKNDAILEAQRSEREMEKGPYLSVSWW
jgi:hypothetical protein